MFLALFLLWIVFNGRLTLEIVLFGAVISGAVYAFCCAFLGYSLQKDVQFLKRLPDWGRYVWLLVCEIVKSNVALLGILYGGKADEIKPKLVTFQTPLKGIKKGILSDCITVTPGTITVLCQEDKLTVHCLDERFADGIENTAFQQALLPLGEEEAQ